MNETDSIQEQDSDVARSAPARKPRTADSRTAAAQPSRPAEQAEMPIPPPLSDALAEIGYVLTGRLGQGGMCEVFLAHHEDSDEPLAVKVLDCGPRQDPTRLKRFMQEFDLTRRIDSRHVMQLYDRGFGSNFAFTVTEYFPAGSLEPRIEHGLSPERALEYLRQLAHALQSAHAIGIVHRDIKPANVLFRDDDTLALIDFGLATWLDRDFALTATGNVLGTPFYMSPEQVRQEPLDGRSDLYSLGILAHEMLSGGKPFNVDSLHGLLRAHLLTPVPELPDGLARYQPLIDRLTAKSPDARFQSAQALLDALEALHA
ncbi:MAG: serine/threonine protein kinase [Gammaproteobacteria bacterium]|nr:serine/threonine protein kinase [Gammaproteobacteria bacterium]